MPQRSLTSCCRRPSDGGRGPAGPGRVSLSSSGQGAFPGHRLPSSCQPARPVPIPVPAASPPAPQGPPPSPSFIPAASQGTHPDATTCPLCPGVPRTPPSPDWAVPKAWPCPNLWPGRRGSEGMGLAVVPCPSPPPPPLDLSPRVSRQRSAPAQRHPTAGPGSAGSGPAQSPFQLPGESPWHLAPACGWVLALSPPPGHGPRGGKRPPKLGAHVTGDMAMHTQLWQDQALSRSWERGPGVLSPSQAPAVTSQRFYRPTGVERTLEASAT